jgi:RNA-directed DNA polymerase
MSASLDNLKAATSLSDVAKLLGHKPSSLAYVLYKLPDAKKYTTFEIPKKVAARD